MSRAGQYRDRVTFQAKSVVSDGGGGEQTTWSDLATVRGHLIVGRGREAVASGRIESQVGSVLRVRHTAVTAAITPANRVLIKSVTYNIRSVSQPDRRNKVVEMVLERGVAP